MAGKKKTGGPRKRTDSGEEPGSFEAKMWAAADALRGSMDAAEYKHVVLGLIFLKYISDAFEEQHAKLEAERASGADPEDPDEYRAVSIFWVPPEARWAHLKAQARQSTIGQLVDDAMAGIERDNPTLKGVLPKDYARPALDKTRLGQLIDLISNLKIGDEASRAKDVLGRVYEYFLSQFASAEGKKGGEFYTPRCVVKLLVEMLEPYRGRVYDPCCGSSGMFVQSIEFIRAHATGNGNGGKAKSDISIYGEESNYTTWRLAKMNLAIRGIEGQIAHGDTFHNDRHPDLKADFILANPPFNVSDWGGDRLREDKRWGYGVPPVGNANFAWVQSDRHHENWGFLTRFEETEPGKWGMYLRLAPSFDHASSLGRELRDVRREELLSADRIEEYARRGRGGIYWRKTDAHGANPVRLVEILARQFPDYFRGGIDAVGAVPIVSMLEIVDHVPATRMPPVAKDFAKALLAHTRAILAGLRT